MDSIKIGLTLVQQKLSVPGYGALTYRGTFATWNRGGCDRVDRILPC